MGRSTEKCLAVEGSNTTINILYISSRTTPPAPSGASARAKWCLRPREVTPSGVKSGVGGMMGDKNYKHWCEQHECAERHVVDGVVQVYCTYCLRAQDTSAAWRVVHFWRVHRSCARIGWHDVGADVIAAQMQLCGCVAVGRETKKIQVVQVWPTKKKLYVRPSRTGNACVACHVV